MLLKKAKSLQKKFCFKNALFFEQVFALMGFNSN
jgi:hypothetical protein